MTDDTTRVRAYDEDKDRINEMRRGNDTQADVIRRLLDTAEAFGGEMDAIEAETDEWTPLEDVDFNEQLDATKADIESIAEMLEDMDSGGLSYDDVKSACAAAIREELPVSEMGR